MTDRTFTWPDVNPLESIAVSERVSIDTEAMRRAAAQSEMNGPVALEYPPGSRRMYEYTFRADAPLTITSAHQTPPITSADPTVQPSGLAEPAPASQSQPRHLTLRQRMRAVGIRSITPSEVIRRSGYLELKQYPQGELVILGDRGYVTELVKVLEHYRGHNPAHASTLLGHERPAAHANQRVRLVGWHRLTIPADIDPTGRIAVIYARFFVGENYHQGVHIARMAAGSNDAYKRRSASLTSFDSLPLRVNMAHPRVSVQRIEVKDIPQALRLDWMYQRMRELQDEVYACNRAPIPSLQERIRAVQYMRLRTHATEPNHLVTITRSGIQYSGSNAGFTMRSDRIALRRIGAKLAQITRNREGDEDDLEELQELFSRISSHDLARRTQYHAVDVWNRNDHNGQIELADCGHLEWSDEVTTPGDTYSTQCESCLQERYVYCEDTSDHRHRDNAYLHDDGSYYTYPEYDDEDDDDDEDYRYPRETGVRNYSANVLEYAAPDLSIVSTPYSDFLMGVELEVVAGGRRVGAARSTHRSLCTGYAIMKEDSSLAAGGFEIVTAPRGLAEHIRRFKEWEPHEDLRAWDPGCCGMHVHISSQAFTAATLGKFTEFINADYNDELITHIAGRHPRSDDQSRQYCQREGYLHMANPKKTMEEKSRSRYMMVNTTNLSRDEARRLGLSRVDDYYGQRNINTVELRIFRASLNKKRLLAQLEFAHAAVMFCRWASMRQLKRRNFMDWLRKSAGVYPHLAKWYGVKANTPVIRIDPKVQQAQEV